LVQLCVNEIFKESMSLIQIKSILNERVAKLKQIIFGLASFGRTFLKIRDSFSDIQRPPSKNGAQPPENSNGFLELASGAMISGNLKEIDFQKLKRLPFDLKCMTSSVVFIFTNELIIDKTTSKK